MMRPLLSLFLLAAVLVAAVPAAADDEAVAPPRLSWPEAGPFGRIDQAQARRGFQVYREICSACHALSLVSYRNLANHWIFEPAPGGCHIDFYVDFEFKSKALQKIIATLFNEAVRRMVAAFETRAQALFGPPPAGGA